MLRLLALPILTLLLGLFLTANHKITQPQTAVYPEHLPGAFTGGFGEESCHSCHFDYALNPESGSLSVEGIPSIFEAGKTYSFTISVEREKLGQAGFQISSRFDDGSQAGFFDATSDNLQFTDVIS